MDSCTRFSKKIFVFAHYIILYIDKKKNKKIKTNITIVIHRFMTLDIIY